ncbi:MAG TPA: competence/damage-inducible protein A [Acidimicrobiales bacterium]|nr:competence/damage-inducible protein A [Acidimicrobiales bacterium]
MRCDVVAIGTELLLGHVVDTNSAWIGSRLAEAGIDCYRQVKVGDNHGRIVAALQDALDDADAVICCGGLGPTQDDITREAIAEVMGVKLRRDAMIEARLRERFAHRHLPESNYKQADVPEGATTITAAAGTAPGLVCPVGGKVIYAVPGVPLEMREMVAGSVVPDLVRRSGRNATIKSRFLRVWGVPESKVAEVVAPRVEALEGTATTIAFLANATEGVRVRVTTFAEGADALSLARRTLDEEEAQLRALLGDSVGGVDDEGLEVVVGQLLLAHGLRLAVAESLTGGIVSARLTSVPGSSQWFVGGVVSYADAVKQSLLEVEPGPVVSQEAAARMADVVRQLMHADVGLSLTGVAGPATQEDQPVGTVYVGLAGPGPDVDVDRLHMPGERQVVRERASTYSLDFLRRRLLQALAGAAT